jgi:NAD(P)-dependent dehydrogenase (short-subunit alcohol dehydrogenase family)
MTNPQKGRLAGRGVAIVGGASGLGRAMALALARAGANVVVGDVRRDPIGGGAPVDEEIRAEGGRAELIEMDVRVKADCERLVETTIGRAGRIDVVIPSQLMAGAASNDLLGTSEDDWRLLFDVNLTGTFLVVQAAVRRMLEQEPRAETRGRVILMASQMGMIGAPGHVAYGALKGATINLARQLATDYAARGIVVNALSPGKIVAPREGVNDDAELDYLKARTPFHRLGRPEDVAGAAVWLASDECSYMSGANLVIDGGWTAS